MIPVLYLASMFVDEYVIPEHTEQYKLLASDGVTDDQFGYSVSISDDKNTVVIGASGDDNGTITNTGSIYVFNFNGTSWMQTKITPLGLKSGDRFGNKVVISGDGNTIVATAPYMDDMGTNSGSVFIYAKTNNVWGLQTKLIPTDGIGLDNFGISAAISTDGNTLLIGAHLKDDNGENSGSVYVYTRSGSSWSQHSKIFANTMIANGNFGYSVAITGDGNTAIVGAHKTNDIWNMNGSAYIFKKIDNVWTQEAKLIPFDIGSNDQFGIDVDISDDGNTVIVGSNLNNAVGLDSGSAYIFVKENGSWIQQSKILPNDLMAIDNYGKSVSISGDGNKAVIGANLADWKGSMSGCAYVFTRTDGIWNAQKKLLSMENNTGQLGWSVSLSNDGTSAILGAYANANGKGAAFIYNL